MNSLILFPEELRPEGRAVVTGERARHLHDWHRISTGARIRGALWGGMRGFVEIISIESDRIELAPDFTEPPIPRLPLRFIVAVPRPQTVKKVIQASVSFGASELHFVRSKNVVPSYLSSKSLTGNSIRDEILKAMEQTGDSIPPAVYKHDRWYGFSSEILPELAASSDRRLIAHTLGGSPLGGTGRSWIGAVGPESGWTVPELEDFTRNGFSVIDLGPRMLRVEHAVVKIASGISNLMDGN